MRLEENESSSCADGQEVQQSEINTEIKKTLSDDSNLQNNQNIETENVQKMKNFEERPEMMKPEDSALYEEILEKLDIKRREKTEQSPDAQEKRIDEGSKQEAYLKNIKKIQEMQSKKQLEQVLSQDFAKIQKLMQSGLINSEQGQNLKKQVLKKAFDKLVQSEKVKRTKSTAQPLQRQTGMVDKSRVFEEFNQNNPDFFNPSGRKEVLDYLKSDGISVGKDELGKISEIIRTVEKSAIDRYLQKVVHEKTLRNSNETAKQRLTANAQGSSRSEVFSKTFTREQIGKMSSAEFAKNEPFIMEQLKKGQIK